MPSIRQFHVVGRKTPTEADPSPAIYRMRIFAPNEVVAKSRFWCVRTPVAAVWAATRWCPPRVHNAASVLPTARSCRYFLHQLHKMKKSTGDILAVSEVRERNANIVKNYGITIRYNSRSGTHNMYKEYRDVSLCGAVEQMYSELAGRHRARFQAIQIVDTSIVPAGARAMRRYNPELHGDNVPISVKRPSIKQFIDSKVKFPLPHRIQRAPSKALRATFNASRPTTFFH
jgi:large subunit ribosomal protein L18Ae